MSWIKSLLYNELPCGCFIKGTARFSDRVTEVGRESQTTSVKRYRNATVRDSDWLVKYECDRCGTRWTDRESGSRSTNFSEENPDVDVKLRIDHQPGLMGGTYHHETVPVVDDEA